MATIKDVARLSGFSVSTVSIVLRGQARERRIPQSTEETILAAAHRINYQPNLSARKLRDPAEGQYTIGLFWAADSRTIVLARVLKGVQQVLVDGRHNINLVVSPFTSGRLCDNKSLQGLTNYNAAVIANVDEADIRFLEATPPKIPVVLYNRNSDLFSCVRADNDAAGRIAAEQFLAKGITDVGAVLQANAFLSMAQRSNSFVRACTEGGITSLPANTVYSDGTVGGGFTAGMEMLERGRIPRGMYCDSDSTAAGLQRAFSRFPDKVPENIELVAIGTAPPALTQHDTPALTLVSLPLEQMAIQSVNLLVDLLRHRVSAPQHITLPPQLLVRE